MDETDQTVAYMQGLNDVLLDATKRASAQIAELRRENTALKRLMAQSPALLTELQDRVTLLESVLAQMNVRAAP